MVAEAGLRLRKGGGFSKHLKVIIECLMNTIHDLNRASSTPIISLAIHIAAATFFPWLAKHSLFSFCNTPKDFCALDACWSELHLAAR